MDINKFVSQSVKIILCLALGCLILWLAFKNVNMADIGDGLKRANYWWLALSLLFGMFGFLIRAARWKLLINPLGYKPSLFNSFNAVMSGYLANVAVPRLGEVTKCVALGRKESIPVDKLFGTILLERTVDVISTLIITVTFVFFASDSVYLFLKDSIYQPIKDSFGLTLGFWLLIGLSILAVVLMIIFKERLSRYKFFAKIYGFCSGIKDGFIGITKMDQKWIFILYTVLLWFCYAMMSWLVVFCLDSTSFLGLNDAVFLLIIGTFGMMVPVQSGFGAFHYIISKGLMFVYGITIEDGLIYAIISHESQILMTIIVGTISTFLIFNKKRNQLINSSSTIK